MDVATASTLTDSYINAAKSSFTQASTKTFGLERSTAKRKEGESSGALKKRQEDCCGDDPSPHTDSRMTTDTGDIEIVGIDHLECSLRLQNGGSSCDPTEREVKAGTRGIERNSSTSQLLDQNIYSSDPAESEERADQEALSTRDSEVGGAAAEAETTQNCRSSPHTVAIGETSDSICREMLLTDRTLVCI